MNWTLFAGSLLRHAMTLGGGALVTNGYATTGTMQEVTGGIIALAGIALSFLEKRRAT